MSFGFYKILGSSCLIGGFIGMALFLISTIVTFVCINIDYYYVNDPDAVKFKMVNCCQITSLQNCETSSRGTTFCRATVKYPSNLQNLIEIVQKSNSAYYKLTTDTQKYEKREEINAPFYFNPNNVSLYEYYSEDYPRNLWLDFNCRAMVEYVVNGTNSELTNSFTSSNYPNLASFNSSLSLTMIEKVLRSQVSDKVQVSKQEQVGDYMNCYTNSNGETLFSNRYSYLYKNLLGWGAASIVFSVLFFFAFLTGIIIIAVMCNNR
ncbi:predicted protein [Naegleria gruberi]|uniref:Predicted protein n=1 Tax=Naegleria gruberi TaxID=5762 RepID=D2VXK0_NAEGR|nr:uncharacterized protein NAEGRDRAFT_73776 [Naegleria gruberi]EFC38523.1 predicted protein [Naegleria gruberi]|eukprot:XP_002671267.1 predicted protein [Naegleria gruberi strain NEG-M]